MKQLNQIILCSQTNDRSFVREIAVFDAFAVVTNIETLPFRYHELLGKKQVKDDLVVTLDVPVKRTASHRGCPFCGQVTIFQCSRCGFLSCADIVKHEHYCPGCKKTTRIVPAKQSVASESGFVGKALVNPASADRWSETQGTLLRLIKHRNGQGT